VVIVGASPTTSIFLSSVAELFQELGHLQEDLIQDAAAFIIRYEFLKTDTGALLLIGNALGLGYSGLIS